MENVINTKESLPERALNFVGKCIYAFAWLVPFLAVIAIIVFASHKAIGFLSTFSY